jgi:RimJ/RimL family protein N-acetyltransferase
MLKGNNIYLRPLEIDDLPLRVEWVNDDENRKTLMFDWPISLSKTRAWFQNTLMDKSKANFSIVDKETNKVIGMTGLIDIDYRNLRGQLYITIGEKDFRGKKLPDEIIPLVLEYGFKELGLRRIYLYTLKNNERGRTVYERNGFEFEGILREHHFCVGEYQDLYVHSILKNDWVSLNNKK